jgi:outer membrane immunogenic protein
LRSLTIAFVGAVVFSSQALGADAAKNFEGYTVQLGTGYQSIKSKTSNILINGVSGVTASDATLNEVPAVLGAGYTFALTNKYLFGVDLEYDLLKSKDGKSNIFVNNALIVNGGSNTKTKNRMSILLSPGYAVNDTTAIFATVGYFKSSTSCTNDDGTACADGSAKGYSLGGKVRFLVNKNVYMFAGASYIKANDKDVALSDGTTFKSKADGYSTEFGVGYKF